MLMVHFYCLLNACCKHFSQTAMADLCGSHFFFFSTSRKDKMMLHLAGAALWIDG